jgi:hypothetical protein
MDSESEQSLLSNGQITLSRRDELKYSLLIEAAPFISAIFIMGFALSGNITKICIDNSVLDDQLFFGFILLLTQSWIVPVWIYTSKDRPIVLALPLGMLILCNTVFTFIYSIFLDEQLECVQDPRWILSLVCLLLADFKTMTYVIWFIRC